MFSSVGNTAGSGAICTISSNDKKKAKTPKTGDEGSPVTTLVLMGVSVLALSALAALWSRRPKTSRSRNRR